MCLAAIGLFELKKSFVYDLTLYSFSVSLPLF